MIWKGRCQPALSFLAGGEVEPRCSGAAHFGRRVPARYCAGDLSAEGRGRFPRLYFCAIFLPDRALFIFPSDEKRFCLR